MASHHNGTPPIIRKAKIEDKNEIVPLIHLSGPLAWNFVFQEGNKTAFDFLNTAYEKRGNTVSYTNHYVAEKDGKVVGSILQYTQPSFLFLTAGTALQILSVYKWKAPKVMARGLKTETIIQPPKSKRLYLGHITVSESYRNQGIAKQLIEFMINLNKEYKTIALDVSCENPSAIALYQKLGFVIKETRHPKGWEGTIPSHHYMEKMISE
jgi:ribosomal protein S18 acetylase RimI-like enzyme